MTDARTTKALSQERFGAFAQGYVTSQHHSAGADLDQLLAWAQPQPAWLALDVATGGGHTALKIAPHVRQTVAYDLTPKMLLVARSHIQKQLEWPAAASATVESGLGGAVAYSAGDAEALPFLSNTFDLVTCRIAPHHFPDCFRFVQEVARVLRPNGTFVLIDNTVPDDERAAQYVNSFERLRDPSHHRMYALYEWAGMFLDAGLQVERQEIISKPPTNMRKWAEMQNCSPEVIEKLEILMLQAPSAVRTFLDPRAVGTPEATFAQHYAMLLGRKA